MEIFIVDDHPVIRQALRSLLEAEPDLTVCGEAATASEALERILDCNADVILVDMSLPDLSGIDLIRKLREENLGAKLAILTGYKHIEYVEQAFAAGASGYIVKDESDVLPDVIRRMANGEQYLSPGLGWDHNPSDVRKG